MLKKQHSNLHTEKDAKITEAFTQASLKLHPEARSERIREATQAHTAVINQALESLKHALPDLESCVHNTRYEVDSTISSLPTLASRQKAKEMISRNHFSAFGQNTAITRSLFPPHTEQVERGNGYRSQQFDHSAKSTWTSLQNLGRQQADAKEMLSQATAFLKHRDNALTFNKPDHTGKLELTAYQQALLDFARANT
ncbi:hypothetical protein O3W44_23310 [Pantoea sp. LMR881]|uniref:hypothetical protein n=1 Tax=Pantoea sp. LMR881 TaxID=3014336 RepID=UPI0022AE5B68|nr:hypothetical protein [Pantoea sp. LMR881]MCZ4061439.1 hypothetical protein [Pantoea sp. LMR881]